MNECFINKPFDFIQPLLKEIACKNYQLNQRITKKDDIMLSRFFFSSQKKKILFIKTNRNNKEQRPYQDDKETKRKNPKTKQTRTPKHYPLFIPIYPFLTYPLF